MTSSGLALVPAVPRAHDPITTRVTWTGEISRIVQTRCVSCHSAGGGAPMSLVTYAEARPWARAIKEEVQTRRMPKWHAVRGYGDFAGDPSLSPFEIALIAAWADGGAPLGAADGDGGGTERSADRPDADARALTVACGDQPLPVGVLLAVTPALERGGSVGLAVTLPGGHREIVAWVRDFDPDFAVSYRLRTPLALPRGSRLTAEYREPATREPRAIPGGVSGVHVAEAGPAPAAPPFPPTARDRIPRALGPDTVCSIGLTVAEPR